MNRSPSHRRWVFVIILFLFLLLHQFDIFMFTHLMPRIMGFFQVAIQGFEPAIIFNMVVSIVFFLVWGIVFDKHARKKLLSVASFIWGATSWMMALAPTYGIFVISKAVSGISNASYSGIYAMVGDFFSPKHRGKILGLFYLAQPLAFLLSMLLADGIVPRFPWRLIFIVVGMVGVVMAVLIFTMVGEPKRGMREPALSDINMTGVYVLDLEIARTILQKPGLTLMYAFSLVGIIPWIVITGWLFTYLNVVWAMPVVDIYLNLLPSLVAIALGYPLGGFLGDILFRHTRNGRLWVAMAGVIFPGLFIFLAFNLLNDQSQLFVLLMTGMGLFMSFTWPNIVASVMDITLPELRATANALVLLFQAVGTFIVPVLVFFLQARIGLGPAILWTTIGPWMLCLAILIALLFLLPGEIERLRRHMAYRSHLEARLQTPERKN